LFPGQQFIGGVALDGRAMTSTLAGGVGNGYFTLLAGSSPAWEAIPGG